MYKKLICLIVLVVALTFASNASAELVAHWSLDDGGGTVAVDMSGNGHDGTVGGTANWVPGKNGGALDFDGSTTYIDVDGEIVRGTWSLAMWLKPRDIPYASADQDYYAVLHNDAWDGGSLHAHLRQNTSLWNPEINGGPNISSTTVLQEDEWYHCVFTISADAAQIYINGALETESATGNSGAYLGPLNFGSWNNSGRNYHGLMDDIRIYDHILSEVEIFSAMEAKPWPFAFGPNPADEAMLEATWVSMSWQPGQLAVSHDVYMSDSFDAVNDGTADAFLGNRPDNMNIVGFPGFAFPDGLVPGTTYYWRIDEVNDADPNSPWKGDVWSFWVPPKKAYEAAPADEAQFIPADMTLEWTGGFNSKMHTVYFGESFDEVDNASGGAVQTDTTFSPGTLELNKTYYWRIDEFDPPATHKGDVWSFTTLPVIPLDSDPDLVAWWTFDEGQGTTALDWSGHGNHATLFGSEWTAAAIGSSGLSIGDYGAIQNLSYAATDLTEVTVAAWVRTTSSGDQFIVSFDRNEYYRLEINGSGAGPGQVGWDVMTSSGQVDYGSINRVDDGAWHHVTGVYDKGLLTIYIDGVPEPSASGGPTYGSGNARFGFIGANSEAGAFNSPTPGGSPVAGEVDDIRIYHRALTQEEIAMVMRGDPKLAGNPAPARDAIVDIRDISSASWSKGDTAASHDVYFGTDRDAMEFKGNQAGTSLSLTALVEFGGGDYFWRIDEVEADGTVNAGTIWTFSVPDSLIVDDIESYNDLAEEDPASNRIYLAWIDGFGTTTNGAVVGNMDVPLTERDNVHGGGQAMPYSYDNNLKTSEATLALTKRDWTAEGVTKLSLWFRGDSANTPAQMFVALNGTAVVYHGDADATQKTGWTEWVIDLTEFAGVDLTNVSSITIGFGTKGAPVAGGGTGTMYFDDIALIK